MFTMLNRETTHHDVHSQCMCHVVFTDGDQQDHCRHELEMIKCRCVVPESHEDEDSQIHGVSDGEFVK